MWLIFAAFVPVFSLLRKDDGWAEEQLCPFYFPCDIYYNLIIFL